MIVFTISGIYSFSSISTFSFFSLKNFLGFCIVILILNTIFTIHNKNINTAIGIIQDVINNIAMPSIKLLKACFPFSTKFEAPSPTF